MAGMKSALELALEKINAQKSQGETSVALTDAQRQEISELRKQYDAKIAEKDIMLQADIRQLMQRHPPQEALAAAQELREKFQQAKKALLEELEAKITTVRSRA
jgi:DNA repair exonuclease SbcCD ATPase subunit